MQSSQIPVKISTPFGNSAVDPTYRHQVPIPSQIGITPGAASFTDGFPPTNFVPVASGGVPPFGNDMNGLLYQMSAWLRWTQAGGVVPYDAAFSTLVSGYPLGAVVASATVAKKFWVSTAENNVTDPDAAGAGWEAWYVGNSGATAGTYRRPTVTADAAGRITSISNAAVPQQQSFTTPGAGTYTTPANATRIKVKVVAGGAGTSSGSNGGVGGTSSFNSVTAIGGSPNAGGSLQTPGQGGIGGDGGIGTGTLIDRMPGGSGDKGAGGSQNGANVGAIYFAGGRGGDSIFGFGARPDTAATVPGTGAGGVSNSNATAGPGHADGGGGGGEGYEMWIYAPAASYSLTVGAGGIAGTNGFAGAPGKIIVTAYFD